MSTVNKEIVLEMLQASLHALYAQKEELNRINVFPVADNDTGINMSRTVIEGLSAAVSANEKGATDIKQVIAAFAEGTMMGSRGNSGTILSQFFVGLSNYWEQHDVHSVKDFDEAVHCGVNEAYAAVDTPVEGTILTVMKSAYNSAHAFLYSDFDAVCRVDFVKYFKVFNLAAQRSLHETSLLLDALQNAEVVDSGAFGFVIIIKSMYDCYCSCVESAPEQPTDTLYCTEMWFDTLNVTEADLQKVKAELGKLGNSIIVAKLKNKIKVHIHTQCPLKALEVLLAVGELQTAKIDVAA